MPIFTSYEMFVYFPPKMSKKCLKGKKSSFVDIIIHATPTPETV